MSAPSAFELDYLRAADAILQRGASQLPRGSPVIDAIRASIAAAVVVPAPIPRPPRCAPMTGTVRLWRLEGVSDPIIVVACCAAEAVSTAFLGTDSRVGLTGDRTWAGTLRGRAISGTVEGPHELLRAEVPKSQAARAALWRTLLSRRADR